MSSFKHIDGRTVARTFALKRRFAEPKELVAIDSVITVLADMLADRHDWTPAQKADWLLACECGFPEAPERTGISGGTSR